MRAFGWRVSIIEDIFFEYVEYQLVTRVTKVREPLTIEQYHQKIPLIQKFHWNSETIKASSESILWGFSALEERRAATLQLNFPSFCYQSMKKDEKE